MQALSTGVSQCAGSLYSGIELVGRVRRSVT